MKGFRASLADPTSGGTVNEEASTLYNDEKTRPKFIEIARKWTQDHALGRTPPGGDAAPAAS